MTYSRETVVSLLRVAALILRANVEERGRPEDRAALEDLRMALHNLNAEDVP